MISWSMVGMIGESILVYKSIDLVKQSAWVGSGNSIKPPSQPGIQNF